MNSVNEELRDRAIRHAVYMTRLASSEVRALEEEYFPEYRREVLAGISPYLAEMEGEGLDYGDLALLASAAGVVRKRVNDVMTRAASDHLSRATDIAVAEYDFERRLFGKLLQTGREYPDPDRLGLRRILETRKIGGKTIAEYFSDLEDVQYRAITRRVREGLLEGESIDSIIRGIRGTRASGYTDGVIGSGFKHAATFVRSSVMAASNSARATFHSDSGIIKGFQVVLTLDSRTCLECVSMLNGNPYSEDPGAPFHLNCRCIVIPVTKSWRELGINADDLPPGTRAAMDGEYPADISYNDWLRRQPEGVQNEVLGKTRADLFREGADVSAFTDRSGKLYNLDQLRDLEPDLF